MHEERSVPRLGRDFHQKGLCFNKLEDKSHYMCRVHGYGLDTYENWGVCKTYLVHYLLGIGINILLGLAFLPFVKISFKDIRDKLCSWET